MLSLSAAPTYGQSKRSAPLLPLPGTGSPKPPQDPNRFTFIVAGDNRPKKETDPIPKTIAEIFAAAKKSAPAFVFLCGDDIYGKNPGNQALIAQEYKDFLALAKTAGTPVFSVPGNHEMDAADDVPNATMQSWYRHIMGRRYGSFDFGNSHFIGLDTEEIPPRGTQRSSGMLVGSGKTIDPGYVGQVQLAWLKQDLAENTDKGHIFIFMHHPMKPRKPTAGLDQASAEALMALFKANKNVAYVVSAHEHLYYNPQGRNGTDPPPSRSDPSNDPPTYLISGGAGAPISETPERGGFNHYLVFDVDKDKVAVKLVRLGPGK